jgi:hypothetical protein
MQHFATAIVNGQEQDRTDDPLQCSRDTLRCDRRVVRIVGEYRVVRVRLLQLAPEFSGRDILHLTEATA